MLRKVIAIGETVLDIFFKDGEAIGSCPGGSALNTAVTLGRLGVPVSFISDLGNDITGKLIIEFLQSNNIDTAYIHQYDGIKTPIALAFLNRDNEAEYSFYKQYPDLREIKTDIRISSGDIIIFGSFFALTQSVRPHLISLLEEGRANNALIIYDPNFRRPHLKELPALIPFIEENIAYADIVRASDEDMRLIFGVDTFEEGLKHIPSGTSFIYTSAEMPVQYRFNNFLNSFKIPDIVTVSTVGAGDAFNAGIIYSLYINRINKQILSDLDELIVAKIVRTGINFAEEVCKSNENYISIDFARTLAFSTKL